MDEACTETSSQSGSGVSVTIVKVMCGNPAGMGQLIKYFESQSKRLDRQTAASHPASLNQSFESSIKFNGVPILPPAITSSRRYELQQYKKDAVLLEKRLRARHHRDLIDKTNSLVQRSQILFPDTSSRQAARQLNFDSQGDAEQAESNNFLARLRNPAKYNSFLAEDSNADLEDFGLQTMDSINSGFMSLNSDSIPRVFSGLVLTSVKEQKISYDLDKLSKALNVQDLASTSGSDISEVMDTAQTQNRKDLSTSTNNLSNFSHSFNLEEKHSTVNSVKESNDRLTNSHQSDRGRSTRSDSDLEKASSVDFTNTSEFVENMKVQTTEQTLKISPLGRGSVNTSMITTDNQWSNRSSPKSLKSGVHFASFVTEYINTSTDESFDCPTILTKKLSSDHIISKGEGGVNTVVPAVGVRTVTPALGDFTESHRRRLLSTKVSNSDNITDLLNNVVHCLDHDTISSVKSDGLGTFHEQGGCEIYSSDKENDVSQSYRNIPPPHKKSADLGNKLSVVEVKKNTEPFICERIQEKARGNETDGVITVHGEHLLSTQTKSVSNSVYSGLEPAQDMSASISVVTSCNVLEGSIKNQDSGGSSKSNTLTNTSQSSIGTIREEVPQNISTISLNIFDRTLNLDRKMADKTQEILQRENTVTEKEKSKFGSPKKLNIDTSIRESDNEVNSVTPSRNNICRNSYTLSEPSPALVQAHGRPEPKRKEKVIEQKRQEMNAVSSTLTSKQLQAKDQMFPTKMPFTTGKNTTDSQLPLKTLGMSDAEVEGKAEHINKYLNEVQFQNSINLNSQSRDSRDLKAETLTLVSAINDEEETETQSATEDDVTDDCTTCVFDVLKSLAESHGSLEQLSVEELLELHYQQMNEKRQALIRQQQQEMEELFVQQRREVILLDSEIRAIQLQEKEQQKFLLQNAPENIKVKSRSCDKEFSPEQTDSRSSLECSVAKNSLIISDNSQSQFSNQLPCRDHSQNINIKLQTKSYPGGVAKTGKLDQTKPKSQIHLRENNTMVSSSPESINNENLTSVKTFSGSSSCSKTGADINVLAITNMIPEFSPSVPSPRFHRVLLRSPLKVTPLQRKDERVVVPVEAYIAENVARFNKVTAAAKGFLTRLLLKSDKVQELIKTIRDTREFALNFQTETPIKKGNFSQQDKVLLERIIAQLQAAVLDIHEIFFEIPTSERLALIRQTRLSDQDKRSKAVSKDFMRESGPKISQATLRFLERKRKSRDADTSSAIHSSRPKTAPARIINPSHTDSSIVKPEKLRPKTPQDKLLLIVPKRIAAAPNKPVSTLVKSNSDSNKRGSVRLNNTNNKSVMAMKSTANRSNSQPLKSWR